MARILLIGDSIVAGHRQALAERLKGRATVAAFSTSKIVGDPALTAEERRITALWAETAEANRRDYLADQARDEASDLGDYLNDLAEDRRMDRDDAA